MKTFHTEHRHVGACLADVPSTGSASGDVGGARDVGKAHPYIQKNALFILVSVVGPIFASLPASAESLWTAPGNGERAMFSDRKASRIGDILTVVVQESAATQSSQKKSTNSAANVDAGVEQFLFPPSVSRLGTHKGVLPAIKLGGSNDFNGGGEVNNTQSLNARAAVLVTDVLPNGNLVIEGVRRVVSAGETQHVVLHGLVRADDVTSSNIVFSSNIADARVEFINEGSLTDAQKKGWLAKLYEKLRPY